MPNTPQRGYLVLADISGFTSYLAGTELDHAHEILSDLLETIINRFKPMLTFSKLEGDAVFAYAPAASVPRGETLLELLESTYVAFRERQTGMHRQTTCTCNACRHIETLDLKFMAHYGEYIQQSVAGQTEIVGSDVNLAHRLMKNHVSEATGWHAYALITERALSQLGLTLENAHPQVETYEHLGEVPTRSLNLHDHYRSVVEGRKVVVTPEEAQMIFERTFSLPPHVLWDWLNDPLKRAQYTFQPNLRFETVLRPKGRMGVGGQTHCVHGKDVAMVETLLDWKPFDYYTTEQAFMGMKMLWHSALTPTPEGGTHLAVRLKGKLPYVPDFLQNTLFPLLLNAMFPMSKMIEKLGKVSEQTEPTPPTA